MQPYPERSLLASPWLAEAPQCVDQGTQGPPFSSGSPGAASLPTGPVPPSLHCGAPSGDIRLLQVHRVTY